MLKMVDGTGIIGVDMVCPLGGTVSPPQPPNFDKVEVEGVGSLMLPNSLKAPLERVELIGNSTQFTTTGAQLTPLSQDNLYNKDGLTAVMNPDGSVNIIGTPTKQFASVMAIEIIGLEAGTYYISGGSINDGKIVYQCNITRADGSREYFSNRLMELKSDDQYRLYLLTYNSSNLTEVNDTIYPMLNKGSKALPFEPYTGGNPSPSPEYPQEIKSVGKNGTVEIKIEASNILPTDDVEKLVNNYRLCTKNGFLLKKGIKYVLTVNEQVTALYIKDFATKENLKIIYNSQSLEYTPSENIKVFFDCYNVPIPDTIKMWLNIDVSHRYEPYKEPQIVKIALNEPLRGYRRDYDGEIVKEILNSSIERRFKEVVITKDTSIVCDLGVYGATEINTIISRYFIGGFKKQGIVLCKELKYKDNWSNDEESIAIADNAIDFRLSRERLGIGSDTTPEENKVAVIKYLTNHPLHCIAELNEPISEPLPESVQQQLQALHSENGTTHVFVDSGEVPCGIKLTYRKEK